LKAAICPAIEPKWRWPTYSIAPRAIFCNPNPPHQVNLSVPDHGLKLGTIGKCIRTSPVRLKCALIKRAFLFLFLSETYIYTAKAGQKVNGLKLLYPAGQNLKN
jgi:hypothetical protein